MTYSTDSDGCKPHISSAFSILSLQSRDLSDSKQIGTQLIHLLLLQQRSWQAKAIPCSVDFLTIHIPAGRQETVELKPLNKLCDFRYFVTAFSHNKMNLVTMLQRQEVLTLAS